MKGDKKLDRRMDDGEEGLADRAKSLKNPAAVLLGRMGGKVGGPARASALSSERRSEIAKKAAAARWAKLTGE